MRIVNSPKVRTITLDSIGERGGTVTSGNGPHKVPGCRSEEATSSGWPWWCPVHTAWWVKPGEHFSSSCRCPELGWTHIQVKTLAGQRDQKMIWRKCNSIFCRKGTYFIHPNKLAQKGILSPPYFWSNSWKGRPFFISKCVDISALWLQPPSGLLRFNVWK